MHINFFMQLTSIFSFSNCSEEKQYTSFSDNQRNKDTVVLPMDRKHVFLLCFEDRCKLTLLKLQGPQQLYGFNSGAKNSRYVLLRNYCSKKSELLRGFRIRCRNQQSNENSRFEYGFQNTNRLPPRPALQRLPTLPLKNKSEKPNKGGVCHVQVKLYCTLALDSNLQSSIYISGRTYISSVSSPASAKTFTLLDHAKNSSFETASQLRSLKVAGTN